jgi:hypothetical protein
MTRLGCFPRSLRYVSILGAATAALIAVWGPVTANVAPDAIIYFNVMPAGDPQSYCTTDITECSQMRSTTEEVGLIEFQIFIYPYSHIGEPITNLTAQLNWPEAWQFTDFAVCRDGLGSLEYWGSNPHHMELNWSCEPVYELFLAATLVFDVGEYGRLNFSQSLLWIGCPPGGYDVWADPAIWGEAGTVCEYTEQPCSTHGLDCIPHLEIEEMTLTAAPDGTAHGETHFYADAWFDQSCHGAFDVATGETWCSAYVTDGAEWWENILMIDADATGLDYGIYETWVRVDVPGGARCLNLIFQIQEPTAVSKASWGRLKAGYRR